MKRRRTAEGKCGVVMRNGRTTWARDDAGSAGVGQTVHAFGQEYPQSRRSPGSRQHHQGWLCSETTDLASLAVAFGFIAGSRPNGPARSEGLALNAGWALR